ncbi:hypothetical protein RHGRI_011410 [Rhododendron griersonianum]|uniref:DDB1- and CUL4-associated factor 13 n=1 Tax=Rhododendron griersonianum TaxID=479676 RepID=A0AAV6KMU7_9ERIC|nr:hypothetical protein RHGRI_011410 [Rhododendron griersonianum]
MCQRVFRNFDPSLRTQEKAVEYVRALNAAKMEKIFARPFVGAMDGHIDSVSCMAKNPNHLKGIFSGSMDGDIRLWDIASRYYLQHLTPYSASHHVIADNLSVSWPPRCCTWSDSVYRWTYSCIMWYRLHQLAAYVWKNAFWAVDHQCDGNLFATAGAQVDIWDHNRSQPVNSFEWGKDTVISVRFNPGEPNVLATSANDRSIAIYDLRMSSPTTKLIMRTRTNSISWNPMEPMNFTATFGSLFSQKSLIHGSVANEDCSCYSYDARKLDEAKCVHKDHVSAVMDIDYSPTGREFVTGSYDRTIRIFQYNGGHSREIYHTKRMQRVFCVKFSCDGSYVISGSDDANLRLWKANASEQLGVILLYQSGCIITRIPTLLQLLPRERKNHEYREAVKNRYKHLPEVKRIVRHRHLLKPIFKASALRRIMIDAERKKDERRRAHSAPGSIPRESIRKKRIIKEIE